MTNNWCEQVTEKQSLIEAGTFLLHSGAAQKWSLSIVAVFQVTAIRNCLFDGSN